MLKHGGTMTIIGIARGTAVAHGMVVMVHTVAILTAAMGMAIHTVVMAAILMTTVRTVVMLIPMLRPIPRHHLSRLRRAKRQHLLVQPTQVIITDTKW